MGTTQEDIARWLRNAPDGSSHMLVVCDTYDYEDYPVYVKGREEYESKFPLDSMQRLMEVYDLGVSHKDQLNEHRAMHPPEAPDAD